jgi:hypothetical protein
MKMNY